MPLVSAIINVHNGAATLSEALDSVLAQSLDDWELIVWDDCSTDGSADIVARYSDQRIRYFRCDELMPLGRARQRAIELARGAWIAFLDQDDIWLPHKLERQMAAVGQANDAALVYGRTVRFYASGRERDYDQAHEYTPLPEGDIFAELFSSGCFIAMSSAMFRRSAIEEIGGIPESISIIPDYYLYTTIARRFQVAAVQEVVCRYRMHADNTSARHCDQGAGGGPSTDGYVATRGGPGSSCAVQTETFHGDCARRDAQSAYAISRDLAPVEGWVGAVATAAPLLLRLSHRSKKCPAAALEDTQSRQHSPRIG